jgi:transposase InsO family protein
MASAIVLKLVQEIREQLPRAGVPKLHFMLQEKLAAHGIKLGRDALYQLLGEHGYLLRYRRRKPYTTNSNHPYKKYPNLIRDIKYLTHPGQLWVSDITYIRLKEKFGYLSIVTDAYSHKIIGYNLHPTLHSNGPVNALLMAAKSKRGEALIHHSDRGSQYCCAEYVKVLQHYHIKISMTEKGDPYENAIAERVNGILKTELISSYYADIDTASIHIARCITIYNYRRRHSSLNWQIPDEVHKQKGPQIPAGTRAP